MDPIMDLARQHGLLVIEDCAQANGATYKGRSVGTFGQVGAWSFCQDKILTTGGEGGMVTTSDSALWERMWSYKDHGKSYDTIYNREHPPGFRWVHESFGTNWRMLEIQAVVGRIQLRQLDEWHRCRTAHAQQLARGMGSLESLRIPLPPSGQVHAWYKLYAFVRPERLRDGWTRDRILVAINDAGVPCGSGICPEIYQEKAFDGTPWRPAMRLPVARRLGETSLMFMVHPTLGARELDLTCDVVRRVMTEATR
jgi:dTDP-4-amino-4,6-dideoxygalactose transaminase